MVALQSGKTVHGVIMGIEHGTDQDIRWIQLDSYPLFRPQESNPYMVFSVVTDITESRKMGSVF
jgi:hypothetical protein